jgi:L-ascorbate metabolism protein UlaG (beta-lactamase superfamily)
MATIRRLADSCLLVTTDDGTSLFDPGFFTWESGEVDLDSIGDVQRVLITHAHADHLSPEFVRWVLDRGDDVVVHSNQDVVDALAQHDIEATTDVPAGTSVEDVAHETLPNGLAPPNRSWTIGELFTHPGDSHQPTHTAPVLALPLMAPWCSGTAAVAFAKRIGPQQVIPIHDFYMSRSGRERITGMLGGVLQEHGIELLPLDWGDSITV